MGSRSIGELLLRPTAIARLPFRQTSTNIRLVSPSWGTTRLLTNSTPLQSAQPRSKDEPDRRPPQTSNASDSGKVSQTIDDLFSSTNNPSLFRRTTPSEPQTPTSADEFNAAKTQRLFGEGWSPARSSAHRRTPIDINSMLMPGDELPEPNLKSAPLSIEIPESEKNYPRLNASYGRTVELDPNRGRDLVRGISMLGSLMARNKVRSDFMKQRFHERPGLKRKRLKSERWRARFKVGFRDVTARVSELTRKGW